MFLVPYRNSYNTPARKYARGIGDAVADRTINRKIVRHHEPMQHVITLPRRDDIALVEQVKEYCRSAGLLIDRFTVSFSDEMVNEIVLNVVGRRDTETWADVAFRVAKGNTLLHPDDDTRELEFHALHHHLRQASILMSGRHLQHGDEMQPSRNMEVFTNCATSATSFILFYLLLNGSGVGRCYDDDMMLVDWRKMPILVPVIDFNHKDVLSGEITAPDQRIARHLYEGRNIHLFEVPDSREGWAAAVEKLEAMTYAGSYHEDVLLLDFSQVRPRGAPIRGMQGRPSSGPGPLMNALNHIARIRDAGMEPWRATMYIDHYLAECVLVGGARRAARMSTKTWRDKNVFDFIRVKQGGFLWSSNNSVTVDAQFWRYVRTENLACLNSDERELAAHAKKVFDAICHHAYHDQTGEPGIINQDKLHDNRDGLNAYKDGNFAESARYKLSPEALPLTKALAKRALKSRYGVITNPCGEIVLSILGGYCVIADVVPYHAASDDDAEDAFRTATRALIRTNLMDSLYKKEVRRTNRIGVGITGIHEYAWKRFGYGFRDLIDEERSKDFWMMLSRFKRAVVDEAEKYSKELKLTIPHTNTTIKPAGTTSKLFGLTEGAHLPSMREYLRWVQFRNDDPLIDQYREQGYPVRKLRTYSGTTIVGFPTQPEICRLGMGDKLVTAAEASPKEQYQWLKLLEKYWIRGVDERGNPLPESGNQVSYTLKYKPEELDFEAFKRTLLEGQSEVRCCTVMPQADATVYEYQPEEPLTKADYERVIRSIKNGESHEDVGFEHVDCSSGACPVDFGEKK